MNKESNIIENKKYKEFSHWLKFTNDITPYNAQFIYLDNTYIQKFRDKKEQKIQAAVSLSRLFLLSF